MGHNPLFSAINHVFLRERTRPSNPLPRRSISSSVVLWSSSLLLLRFETGYPGETEDSTISLSAHHFRTLRVAHSKPSSASRSWVALQFSQRGKIVNEHDRADPVAPPAEHSERRNKRLHCSPFRVRLCDTGSACSSALVHGWHIQSCRTYRSDLRD